MSRLKALQSQQGFTLVETLLSLLILGLVMAMATGVVMSARASTRFAHEWGDRGEQLRVAFNQMGEDFAYAQWCCAGSGGDLVQVTVQQHRVDAAGFHADWAGWPGWIREARFLRVEYGLEGSDLVRTVRDYYTHDKVYSRQVLANHLVPYADDLSGSYFELDSSRRMIKAVLRTIRTEAGVNSVAEVHSEWFVR